MANSRLAANRIAATQPTYDFLSGGSGAGAGSTANNTPVHRRQPLGTSRRQSVAGNGPVKDIGNEDLRAQIKTLQYDVQTLKAERELSSHKHEKELRDAEAKAEEVFRRARSEESRNVVPVGRYEGLRREVEEVKDRAANEKCVLEKRVRVLEGEVRGCREEVEEGRVEREEMERGLVRRVGEGEERGRRAEEEVRGLRKEVEGLEVVLGDMRERAERGEWERGELEGEVLRLRGLGVGGEEMVVVKRELGEQVGVIRRLEGERREMREELGRLRRGKKAVEVVEEEKRVLRVRLGVVDEMGRELREAQLQRQILEDERGRWASYLENEGAGEEGFEGPEDVARALVRVRVENAELVKRLGGLQPELLERDEIIRGLEEERSRIQVELEKLRASAGGGSDTRAKQQLERQQALDKKEVELLRERLRTFDSEEQTYHSENTFDAQKSIRIADLETLVDQHRTEIQILTDELSAREQSSTPAPPPPQTPLKRPREDDSDTNAETHHLGQLARKNRKLQDDLSTLHAAHALLQSDHKALQTQLAALQASAKTRVLALRANPTAAHCAIKQSTLTTLQHENKDLLAQLESRGGGGDGRIATVPGSTLDALRLEMQELERKIADREKRMDRLKKIWGNTATEFREAVLSILGWKLDFHQSGKVALSLPQRSAQLDDNDDDAEQEDGEGVDGHGEQSCIVFDGEKGTMKVAGGPDSSFGREISGSVRVWVERKRCIPGLMASIMLSRLGGGEGG